MLSLRNFLKTIKNSQTKYAVIQMFKRINAYNKNTGIYWENNKFQLKNIY